MNNDQYGDFLMIFNIMNIFLYINNDPINSILAIECTINRVPFSFMACCSIVDKRTHECDCVYAIVMIVLITQGHRTHTTVGSVQFQVFTIINPKHRNITVVI